MLITLSLIAGLGKIPPVEVFVTLAITVPILYAIYIAFLDVTKAKFELAGEELDPNKLDYRLRLFLKAVETKVIVLDRDGDFGVMVLPKTFRRPPYIVITRGALQFFKDGNLDGVIAHEVGHVIKKHWLLSLLFVHIVVVASVTIGTLFIESFGLPGVIPTAIETLALMYVLVKFSKDTEFEADEVATLIVGKEKVLRSLNFTKMFTVQESGIFDTHPPLSERIERVRKLNTERTKL